MRRAAALLALILTACSKPTAPPPAKPKPAAEPPRATTRTLPGHLEAQHVISVDLPKPAAIDSLFADVGQDISEGQILARLSTGLTEPEPTTPLQKKVDLLKSSIEDSKLQSAKAKADAQHAKDDVARTQKTLDLQQKLNSVGATPRRTFEQARDEFTAAQKESARVEESWRQSDNRTYAFIDQLAEATAALDAANKKSDAARAALNTAEIHAPASGIIIARQAQIGPTDGKQLFQIATDPTLLRAIFDAPNLPPGTAIQIILPGIPTPLPATITKLDGSQAQSDFTSPTTALRPGMPCSVTVPLK